MSLKGNVISLPVRKNKGTPKSTAVKKHNSPEAPVLDMSGRREEMIDQERRKVKRTILSEFIGVHALVPQRGLISVGLFDISNEGLSFDLKADMGRFRTGDEVAMRVYLNHKTYFSFVVKIINGRALTDTAMVRHGASFVKGSVNEEALHHFVKFIETVSANLKTDTGDVTVSNLTRARP